MISKPEFPNQNRMQIKSRTECASIVSPTDMNVFHVCCYCVQISSSRRRRTRTVMLGLIWNIHTKHNWYLRWTVVEPVVPWFSSDRRFMEPIMPLQRLLFHRLLLVPSITIVTQNRSWSWKKFKASRGPTRIREMKREIHFPVMNTYT